MQSFISLDRHDNFASIRAKLDKAQGDILVLDVPRGVRVLRDPINIRLLRRYASSDGREIAIVTKDSATASEARRGGVRVSSSWRELPAGRATADGPGDSDQVRTDGIALWPALAWASLVALLVVLLFGGWILLPNAAVTMRLQSQEVSHSIAVTADIGASAVDNRSMVVPAHLVEGQLEASAFGIATGVSLEPQQAGQGFVTFLNMLGEGVKVPSRTNVSTASGVAFATAVDIEVPPGLNSRATVEVRAINGGSVGNVPALTINRILDPDIAIKLAVVNEGPTRGGADTKSYHATADDIERLRDAVREEARTLGLAKLKEALTDQDYIYSQTVTVKILGEDVIPDEGGSPEIELRVRGLVQAMVIRGENISQLIARIISEGAAGSRVMPGSLRVQYLEPNRWDAQQLSFNATVEGLIIPAVDKAAIKRRLAGMTKEEASSYLLSQLPLDGTPKVDMGPFWVNKMPRFPWQVKISVIDAS